MKYIRIYHRLALGALLLAACTEAEEFFVPNGGQTVGLTLTVPGTTVTRATEAGTGTENAVNSVDLFFYPTGQTASSAVVHKRIMVTSEGTDIGDGKVQYTLESSVGIGELRLMYPDYDTSDATQACEAYAIVNLPADASITSNDVSSLKKIALSCADFKASVAASEHASLKSQKQPDDFVMSGQTAAITLSGDKRTISGNVDVYRAAAKISLELTEVKDEFVDKKDTPDDTSDDITWKPSTDDIYVRLRHGQTNGYVDAPELHTVTGDFTSDNMWMKASGNDDGHYVMERPFYTYPNDWSNDASHRTSLLVCIRWENVTKDPGNYRPTYYEIPISDEDEQLMRNTHYHIELSIGIIGSLSEETPVELTKCSYVILPWNTNETVVANMSEVRYLVVDEDSVVMDNIISRDIYFSSSHKVINGDTRFTDEGYSTLEVYNKHLYHRDLRNTDSKWEEVDPASASNPYDGNGFRVVINQSSDPSKASFLSIEHDLDNSGGADADYTQYKMEFYIYHSDEDPTSTKYIKRIVAIQNPMVYADAEPNSNYIESPSNFNSQRGYTFLNNGTGQNTYYFNNTTSSGFLGGVSGISSTAKNQNPNRYIIKATMLVTGDYVIGDPRTSFVNNELTDATILNERSNVYDWSGRIPSETGKYTGVTGRTYGNTYQQYRNNNNVYRDYESRSSAYITFNYSWEYLLNYGYYHSEQNAYHRSSDGWYYWATRENTGSYYSPSYTYTYHRARYYTTQSGRYNTLEYYYPTDENGSRTSNMISPEFMVASSYGVCNVGIPKENARKRCASYQEDGYPAGRWRLPTAAEVQYIVQLSAWGKIPILFGSTEFMPDGSENDDYGSNSYYWSANGIIRVNSKEGDASIYTGSIVNRNSNYGENGAFVEETNNGVTSYEGVSVRCVYDTWYWGRSESDKCDKNTFTWGDEER